MDSERWASRWQPSGDTRPVYGRDAERDQPYARGGGSYFPNSSYRQSSHADDEDRWTRREAGQQRDSYHGGSRPCKGRESTVDHTYEQRQVPRQQRQYHPRHYTPQNHHKQYDTPASSNSGAKWVGRPKHEGMCDLEVDLLGDAFGGLDPGEVETVPPTSGNDGQGEGDPLSDQSMPISANGALRRKGGASAAALTLAQLEEAVSGGEPGSWSLERLAEAAAAICQLQPASSAEAVSIPFTRREEAVMDAIATATICCARRCGPVGNPAATAWAVAQLLWACARGQYWCGPPKPRPGTWAASAAEAAAAAAADLVAGVSLVGESSADAGNGVLGRKRPLAWPSPGELRSQGPAAEDAAAATDPEPRQPSSGSGTGGEGEGGGAADAPGGSSCGVNDDSSNGTGAGGQPWRPLAVELLSLLASDSYRLVSQLDSRSLSLVWWALAKAAAAARVKHGGAAAHLPPAAVAAAAAAAEVLAAAVTPLIVALDSRAVDGLQQKGNPQLCALLYSCACVGRTSEKLQRALGDELAARLEHAAALADAGIIGSGGASGRGWFSARELSCIGYSCGLLGLRHDRLMAALSEYAASCSHATWSASAISVFMYGIANVGHRDARLMAWAEDAISAKAASEFNLRNISFLLYNFHRLRWWPRRAAAHLLGAMRLHAPATIPLISSSTILMCMGSGRARDAAALAHLCDALTRRPTAALSCKDVCICLTALQRLHGEDVLASQQPEVLAALDHLVGAILERGFSRPGPACGAVVVFNHQEVSNAIFALGKLKYYSPAVLEALRDHAALGGLEGASAWDCTAILVGLAQLNYAGEEDGGRGAAAGSATACGRSPGGPSPGAAGQRADEVDLVGLLAAAVARMARSAKSQDLANTLWALSVLEGALERYRPLVVTLMEEVNRRGPSSRNPDGLNVDEQRQLWQVHRELAALPQPYAALREDLVRLGRLGMSEADHTFSRVQASFQSLLNAMFTSGRYPRLKDLLFEQELVPGGEQLMRIDVQAIIERPKPGGGTERHRVALEFDGPFHFMVNEPYTARIDGRTALRNRILTRHLGKDNLVCVSMAEWVAASREPLVGGLPGRWRLMAGKMGL